MEPQNTYSVPPQPLPQPQVRPEPPQPPKHRRIVLIVIIALVLLAAISSAVWYFFIKGSTAPTKKAEVALVTVDVPEKIIEDYTNAEMANRDSLYTKRELLDAGQVSTEPTAQSADTSQGPTNSVVTYTKKDSFTTQITSSDYVQYERKEATNTSNDTTFAEKTEAYLVDKGLVKLESTDVSDGIVYVIYNSENVICQISDIDSIGDHPATYGLACVLKQVIDTQYDLINSLLKLAPESDVSAIESAVAAPPIIDGSKQLITITITKTDKAQLLYFATLTDDWEYIGQVPITNPDDEESFKLSDDIKAAISDAKWGGFLEKYIK